MNTDITFSVVIPLFNKEKTIITCVESVLGQKLLPKEIIVVDDKSTDGSLEKLQSLGSPLVKVFSQDNNRGPSFARNFGVNVATGSHIVFLDADDIISPIYLSEALKVICGSSFRVFGVGYTHSLEKLRTTAETLTWEQLPKLAYYTYSNRKTKILTSSSVIIEKNILKNYQFLEDVRFGEDVLLWCLISENFEICYCPEYLVFYDVGDDSSLSKEWLSRGDETPVIAHSLSTYLKTHHIEVYKFFFQIFLKTIIIKNVRSKGSFEMFRKYSKYLKRRDLMVLFLISIFPKSLMRIAFTFVRKLKSR